MRRYLVLLVIFFSLCAKAHPISIQEEEGNRSIQEVIYDTQTLPDNSLDESLIREYQNDSDFNYIEIIQEDNAWTRFKQWLSDMYYSFMRWLIGDGIATGFWAFVVNALPYILLGMFVAGLVWLFMRIDSGKLMFEKMRAPEAFMGDDEDIIQNQNIQELIDRALAAGNYRLAVRYYYLLALQRLSGKELINWQVQKTNHDYIFEIEDQHLQQQFRRVTDIYDYIWYGNFEVDASAFAKAQLAFTSLNNKL